MIQIDPHTGAVTPIVTGLSAPHGLAFVPSASDPSHGSGAVASTSGHGAAGSLQPFAGNQTANIALLTNYMASAFPSASAGHSGTLINEPAQATQQQLVTPHHA